MSNPTYITQYLQNIQVLAAKMEEEQHDKIDEVVTILWEVWQKQKPVYLMGNGGSASTASHFAADLSKTINDKPGFRGIRALTPWENIPLASAIVNDRPKEDYFTAWLDTFYEEGGVGVGISVHGGSGSDVGGKWSQNLLKGLQYIKDRQGTVIGLSGFDGGPLKGLADVCIVVPAESTSLVESFHVVIQHLIVFRLKELIEKQNNRLV